jgi:bacteriocin biosynthesis cyclodehydratase domain-containing protein
VAVVGLGGVGACVSRILALSCVGRVIGIDLLIIDPSDLIFGYGADQIGQLRTNALAAQFTLAGSGTTFVPISEGFYENKLESLCDNKPDVLVRCDDSMSLNGYDAINSFCISYNLPWVSARIDRSEATIGPFIYPNETACFTCFELRSRANSPQPSDHESLYRHWKTIGGISAEWPILAPEPMMVASYIVHDLLRFLSGQIPVTLGRVLNIDFRSLESKFHEVLKLPRCPTCSRWQKRPLTQIWDIRTQDNDITSAKKI